MPLPPTGRSVGVDVGVARFLDAAQQRIADLQRRTQRARPGSGNHRRLRRRLARAWRKVHDRRRDFPHKTARGLVDTCDVLAPEALRVDRTCPAHGMLDADLNGARNIATRAGLGSGQAPAA